jgi:hypothetical protein
LIEHYFADFRCINAVHRFRDHPVGINKPASAFNVTLMWMQQQRDMVHNWMAGGGVKAVTRYGETDELGERAVVNRHHLRDLHATILHQMGLDHSRLTYPYAGLDQRLTGVEVEAKVIRGLIA